LIGTASAAMEEELHEAAGDGLPQGQGDAGGGPIEITATASHHHKGAAMGAGERPRGWWIGQRAKQRRGGRRFGAWKEQTHRRIGREKGG
jgi:hypothetical protein